MRKIIITVLFSILILAINFSSVVERAGDSESKGIFKKDYWAVIVIVYGSTAPFLQQKNNNLARKLSNSKNWEDDHIKCLVGRKAKKENILDALDWLNRKVGKGDRVLIVFSCHGCQINDTNGDERDEKDEAIVTYDALKGETSPDTVITDDELGEKLDNIEKKGIDGMCVVLDCCLAGGFVGKKDIRSGGKRVIIASTVGNNMALGTRLIGSFTTLLLRALEGGGIFKSDRDRDGWVSAEEAFKWARKRYFAQNFFIYFAIIPTIIGYISDYNYNNSNSSSDSPIWNWLKGLPIMVVFYALFEICAMLSTGELILPIPVMKDNDRGEELELVQLR